MKNYVLFQSAMFKALLKGMSILHEAVSNTIGASGRNAAFRKMGIPMITNDGISIADRQNLVDEAESLGADLLRQAAKRTDEEANDGTSTAVMLGYAMVKEGVRMIESNWWKRLLRKFFNVKLGSNPMRLKREMEQAAKDIVEEIKAKSTPITTDEQLFNVANISMENPEIATLVRDAVKRSGPDGTVIVDESTGITVEKEEIDGLRFDKGYISPYMVTNMEKMECVMEDVPVLITDKTLNLNNDMFGILDALTAASNPSRSNKLLIIAEDVSGELLATFIANRVKQGGFHAVAVKKPYSPEMLQDIAVLTGGEALTKDKVLGNIGGEHLKFLGFAKKIIVTKDSTVIVGAGDKAKIEERIKSIKTQIETAENYEKFKLKERLAKLVGGVVIIKVGAPTEAEMKYLKLKVDDAVGATRAAVEEGIVIGGGRTLYDISLVPAKTEGEAIVRKACGAPMRKIIENTGENVDAIIASLGVGQVFDARALKVSQDPMADGIIDPAKVERCALANATSFAALFLSSQCAIIDVPENPAQQFPKN